MNVIKRAIRTLHGSQFSNDGDRIYTWGRYVCGWSAAALEPIFRVRPLADLTGIAVQPGGDLLISGHVYGAFAIMDGRTGELIASCADRGASGTVFGLSSCSKYIVHAGFDEAVVREIESNRVVWRSPGRTWRTDPACRRKRVGDDARWTVGDLVVAVW